MQQDFKNSHGLFYRFRMWVHLFLFFFCCFGKGHLVDFMGRPRTLMLLKAYKLFFHMLYRQPLACKYTKPYKRPRCRLMPCKGSASFDSFPVKNCHRAARLGPGVHCDKSVAVQTRGPESRKKFCSRARIFFFFLST